MFKITQIPVNPEGKSISVADSLLLNMESGRRSPIPGRWGVPSKSRFRPVSVAFNALKVDGLLRCSGAIKMEYSG